MALLSIIGLMTIEAVIATTCDSDSFSICAVPNTFPLNFPESAKELEYVCKVLSDYMRCALHHELECHGKFEYQESYNRVYGTLQNICKKGSELNNKLSTNIGCIKKQMAKQNEKHCLANKESAKQSLYLAITGDENKSESEVDGKEWDMMYCLLHAVELSCFLENVKDCGNETKEAATNIVKESGFARDGCPAEIVVNVTNLLPQLQLEFGLENQIRDVFVLAQDMS